jgi:hypothetical protein
MGKKSFFPHILYFNVKRVVCRKKMAITKVIVDYQGCTTEFPLLPFSSWNPSLTFHALHQAT